MATVNFYLNSKANTNNEKLILLYFRYHKRQIVITTNELINPENWDFKSQRAKAKHHGYVTFNKNLEKYRGIVYEAYNKRTLYNLSIDSKAMKLDFEKELKPYLFESLDVQVENNFKNCLTFFMEQQIELKAALTNPNTLKIHKRSLSILLEFEKSTTPAKKVMFDDINFDFYQSWKTFVTKQFHFQDNTINKHTGIIKQYLDDAYVRGYHQNLIFKHSKFSTSRAITSSIYLSESEIESIRKLDLSQNKRLDRIRDLFIIACYTGLRYSDFINLKQEYFRNDLTYIEIERSIKTGVPLFIPIRQQIRDIFLKYKVELGKYAPPHISNQKMNESLKIIGEMAGINDDISTSKKVGSEISYTIAKKFDHISCHTARRSFATNEYLAGTPVYEIMALTGHKTEKSFLIYIKITQEEHAKNLAKRWKLIEQQNEHS